LHGRNEFRAVAADFANFGIANSCDHRKSTWKHLWDRVIKSPRI
jgi:hypothetical protein